MNESDLGSQHVNINKDHTLSQLVDNPRSLLTTVEQVNDNLQRENRKPGKFYRYMSLDTLLSLANGKDIAFDPKSAYSEMMSERFNPNKLPAEQCVPFFFLSALEIALQVELDYAKLDEVLEKGNSTLIDEVIERFGKEHPCLSNLRFILDQSIKEGSTEHLVDVLKQIGGDDSMALLKKYGWDIAPMGAFSDFIPISVGAPLGVSREENIVVAEFNFDEEDIFIPRDDSLNEHEIFTRKITPDQLSKVYGRDNLGDLWRKLHEDYPDYFNEGNYADSNIEALGTFARKVPLESLIK